MRGFTLIEITITLAILVALAFFVGFAGYDFYRGQSFSSERDTVHGLLRSARAEALNNIDQANHGLYIGAGQYVLFEGGSYATRNAALDVVYPRLPGVTVAGLNEIVFSSPDGGSNASGTVTLTSGAAIQNINLNYEGRIN